MPNNPWELAGRIRKATALADFLADAGCTAEMAHVMNREQWRAIAKRAGVNPPNSQETKDMIIDRLRLRKVRMIA